MRVCRRPRYDAGVCDLNHVDHAREKNLLLMNPKTGHSNQQ